MLKTKTGYSQIDHIVISPYGIFVIEAKNLSGRIYGSQDQKQWTQTHPNGFKNKFYNPIWQNNSHIKALKENLRGFRNLDFYPIVTFTGRSELFGINHKELKTGTLAGILKQAGISNDAFIDALKK